MSKKERGGRRQRGVLGVALLLAMGAAALLIWQQRREPGAAAQASAGPRGATIGWRLVADEGPEMAAGAIEGQVLGPDGVSVEGALVAGLRQIDGDDQGAAGERYPATARTDTQGHFRIDGLPPGGYTVTASAAGLTGAHRGGLRVAARETTRVDIRLGHDGVTLAGRVLDSGGGTIPMARVRALHMAQVAPAGSGQAVESFVFEAQADDAGAYRLQLPPGQYLASAQSEGYTAARELLEVTADRSKDFHLEPAARISGRVVSGDDRAPVAGAEVVAEPSDRRPDHSVDPVTTDEQGAFELGMLAPGSYRLSARKGSLSGASAQALSVPVGGTLDGLEIVVTAGLTLQGTVKSTAGRPIAGARVWTIAERPTGGMPADSLEARSDREGHYLVEGLQPGRYRVNVSADGHAPESDELSLDHGTVARHFALQAGTAVRGVVLTAAGQPASGAVVEARVRPLERSGMGAGERSTTDSQGRFELERVVPGQLTITARYGGEVVQHGPESLVAGDRKELTIRLAPGARVSGSLLWDDDQPGAKIKIVGSTRAGGGLLLETHTAADGSFTIGPFPPGEASVLAMLPGARSGWSSPGDRPEQANFTLAAGEHRTGIKLTVSRRNGTIRGVVLGPAGQPIDAATVRVAREWNGRAWKGGGSEDERATAGPDGAFRIDGLMKGRYTLWATHPDFAEAERTGIDVGAADVQVQLGAGAAIAGVVVDHTGTPLKTYTLVVLSSSGPGEADRSESWRARPVGEPLVVNDAGGAFRIERMAVGTYDLLATAPDGSVAQLSGITISEGAGRVGLRLVAERAITLVGQVIDGDSGRPLPGVRVRVSGTYGEQPQAMTDKNGAFTVPGVPRLPTLYATLEPAQRTHLPASSPLPPARDGRVDLGTIRMRARTP